MKIDTEKEVIYFDTLVNHDVTKAIINVKVKDVDYSLCASYDDFSESFLYEISDSSTNRFCELYRDDEPEMCALFLCIAEKHRSDFLAAKEQSAKNRVLH